ncbi:hypothetical protein Tco_1415032 [Tanacetum coccineum]
MKAGLEEAIKLQAQMDEEVAKQIHLDKMIAKRMAEEEELSEQQKKRKAKVQEAAQNYTKEDWDTIRAKLEANAELTKSLQGESMTEFSKKQKIEDVPEEKVEEPMKKIGKRKKQIARKGIHIDKSAQDEAEEENEVFMKDKVTGASSKSEEGIDDIPTAIKPPSIVDWKIIPQSGLKCIYQIIRRDGSDKIYMSFRAILKDFSRDDLTELYRLVMKKYGENRPEEMYDRVLWGDLKTMFDPPLSDDAIWSLPLQPKMIN